MQRIDPRAPRLGAAITSLLSLSGFVAAQIDPATGITVLAIVFLLFAWGVFAPKTHPYGLLFGLLRPKLSDPEYLEDPRPPRFAQQVGLSVSTLGLLIAFFNPLAGALTGLGIVFVASALNAYFDFCLGCVMYLRIKRFQRALAR